MCSPLLVYYAVSRAITIYRYCGRVKPGDLSASVVRRGTGTCTARGDIASIASYSTGQSTEHSRGPLMTATRRTVHRVAALLLGAALVLTIPAARSLAAGSLFQAYQAVAVPSEPDAVAIGDVTGDGRADVVYTTGYSFDASVDFRLWVMAQGPDGSLAAPVSYATAGTYPDRPGSVVIGDLTGDGRQDVVVGLSGMGIQVFPQLPDGTLGAPTLTPTPDSLRVGLGHLDGNDSLDVAGIGWGSDTVTVFPNDGSGALGSGTAYAAQHDGYDDLEVADVTGDGLDDLVVMSGQGWVPNVSLVAQVAGGGFAPPVEYQVGNNILTQGIGVGDVTGDGRNDVVASYGGNKPASNIAVFAQDASGALAAPVSYTSYDIPEPVSVADVNRDGRADVVVVHGGWNAAGVYLGQTDGTLGAETLYGLPYASHYNPQGMAVGDITGDGWPDVVVGDYNNGIVILRGSSVPQEPPSAPRSLAASPNLAAGIGLTWKAPQSSGSAAVSGYRIYRGGMSGSETLLATIGNTLAYTDTTAANGGSYWYQVSALSAAGEGPRSGEVMAQRGTAPSAPRSLTARSAKASVTLSWLTPSSDGGSAITWFRIYRGASSGTETLVATVSAGTHSFKDTSSGRKVTHWYRVTAVNALGESVPSNEVSAAGK